MPRRRGALLAWGLGLALAVGACSGPPVSDHPVPGGKLRVDVRDLGSLDPAVTTGRGALFVIAQLYDSLTAIDPKSGDAIPAAASSWKTTPDGLKWTFTIAPATFHDGEGVRAQDFKSAFDRISRKSTNSDVAFQLESVKGFQAAKILGNAPGLAGVLAPNASTLLILLDRPFAELAQFLAHPALGPIAKSQVAKPAQLQTMPIGNGPFRMAGARSSSTITLDRFTAHAGATAYLDHLEVRLTSDAKDSWRDFLAGRTDVAEVPAEALSNARARAGKGGFGPFWAGLYYGPNTKSPKYAKPEVRKAISLAIDRKAIADVIYGGTKDPATGLIPEGVRGFRPDACADCVQDAERARSLVQAAFGGKPPEMIIDHLDASPSREVARAVAEDLQSVGLKVALRAHNSTDYLKLLQTGRQEIAELGWLAEVPSPDGFLAQQLRTGSPNNHSGFSDRGFDAFIDQARAATDETARMEAYRKAEARSFEVMPLIPIVFFRNHIAVAERVRGLQVDGAGLFDAALVWIAR